MQRNKLFSLAIALLLIAISTTSWVSPKSTGDKMPVAITVYVFAMPHPGDNPATFTITGAFEAQGTSVMTVYPKSGVVVHCTIVLTDGNGTITIHQECNFATKIPQGRWEIVSGDGAYANLRGNGSLTMPGNESMVGFIY